MHIERPFVSGLPQQCDHALTFPERVDADQMRAFREYRQRMQQALDLMPILGMAEHRQSERRPGDEDVTRDWLERRTGRIGSPLVIARDDDACPGMLEHHLRAA